jgi:SAM-dependent methyltransferase
VEPELGQAQAYVGSVGGDYFLVGDLQLELLQQNGCTPRSHVLEIGCGCLVAGRPIIRFLEPGRYVGIEPNTWLLDAVKKGLPETADLIHSKRPIFLDNWNFDASAVGRKFDFIISHSILSHAAAWQLPVFLKSVKSVLAPLGVTIASLRFSDALNILVGDSNDPEWVYPGVSYFAPETVQRLASEFGLSVEWRPDYREFFTKRAPTHYHDWIKLTHEDFSREEQAQAG